MDRTDPSSYEGQAGYSRFLLAIYDPFVLGFMAHAVWRCPIPPVVERYRRHHVADVLAPDGVLFGGTVLDTAERHKPQARAVLRAFNWKGDFDNLGDTAEGLREILRESFRTVEVDVTGSVAHFTATGPALQTWLVADGLREDEWRYEAAACLQERRAHDRERPPRIDEASTSSTGSPQERP